MERLDHTNLDFERLSEPCSPFIQDLVVFVVTRMHDDLETFLKANCRAVDDDEDMHKHRYWDMFQGEWIFGRRAQGAHKHHARAHAGARRSMHQRVPSDVHARKMAMVTKRVAGHCRAFRAYWASQYECFSPPPWMISS